MPYTHRATLPHRCSPPDQRSKEGNPIKGDEWQCPDCQREFYCSGWMALVPGLPYPQWRRTRVLSWWWHNRRKGK